MILPISPASVKKRNVSVTAAMNVTIMRMRMTMLLMTSSIPLVFIGVR